VDVEGRRCLVVGGGPVATEKVEKLLDHGAVVRLVTPAMTDALAAMVASGAVAEHRARGYAEEDLDGCFLVIAATNLDAINRMVWQDAEARNLLCNVVDVPPLCNFILPAIVRTGPLAIAISTAGASPALAKRMKREIAETYGEPYARLAVALNDARGWAKATLPTYRDRKEFFEGIVNGDPDPVELIRAGREDDVRALIEAAKESHPAPAAS
jgi:siroheme synthase-like protein